MRQALDYLRTGAVARTGSVVFVFMVAWMCGVQAAKGMTGEQWMAAAASVAGAILVAILVHGPSAAFAGRPPKQNESR